MMTLKTFSKKMLDYDSFKTLESSWHKLKSTDLPIVIYGMGDGCKKILSQFDKYEIKCSGIFASDEFVRGHEFAGYKVVKYSDICNQYKDFIIVPAFGTSIPELMNRLDRMAMEHHLIMVDTPVCGDEYFCKDEFLKRFELAQKVYSLLADDLSKQVFEDVLKFKITGEPHRLSAIFTTSDEAYKNILQLENNESYVDIGAYTGDTILEFLSQTNQNYKKITAFEPNKKNFRKCVKNTLHLDNIELYNCAAWSSDCFAMFSAGAGRQAQISATGIPVMCRSVDSVVGKNGCSYIKYDAEGADRQAILGSRSVIDRFSPKICTALYHRAYDIIDIPLLIHELNPQYKMFMRQYSYYPAWETNLFCHV